GSGGAGEVHARQDRCRDGPGGGDLRHNPLNTSMASYAWVSRVAGRHCGPCPRRARSRFAEARTIISRSDGLVEHSETDVIGGGREDSNKLRRNWPRWIPPRTHKRTLQQRESPGG
ncbi:unnamed protein product, partial [Ectocarpus sp. 6 AP-2014]